MPYWKIGLMHLDSFASTVVQTCSYWGNDDQCGFCGIGVSLDSGRTIVKKSPEQLAEVAMAAKELDGAVDAIAAPAIMLISLLYGVRLTITGFLSAVARRSIRRAIDVRT